jgi:ABC-2 type transport system permease protein
MTGFGVLLGKELLEQWRTLRLPVVAIVFLLVGLGSPLLARYTPELIGALAPSDIPIPIPPPSPADSVAQLLRNLMQFGGLGAILLAMGAVAAEKERGTAALLMTTPASRAAFLATKATAIAVTLGLGVAIATAAAWVYTTLLFEPLPVVGFAAAGLLAWLILAAFAALTFVASTVLRSPAAAGGVGFGLLLGLSILSSLPRIGDYLPPGLIARAQALATGEPAGDVLGPVVATVALIVACLLIATAAFRRQEL